MEEEPGVHPEVVLSFACVEKEAGIERNVPVAQARQAEPCLHDEAVGVFLVEDFLEVAIGNFHEPHGEDIDVGRLLLCRPSSDDGRSNSRSRACMMVLSPPGARESREEAPAFRMRPWRKASLGFLGSVEVLEYRAKIPGWSEKEQAARIGVCEVGDLIRIVRIVGIVFRCRFGKAAELDL